MKFLLPLSLLLFFASCASKVPLDSPPKLSIINIIDNNGMSETISSPERLKQYEEFDFLECQPFKKVMRIYARDKCGIVKATITSYHPNGQPWQYLEVENGRAYGNYREWYSSGLLKIKATVIGGEADVTSRAEKTWLFDGLSEVWDEQGNQIASLPYSKGYLEGVSTYYHPCGSIWKLSPYCKGNREGVQQIFKENGELLSQNTYSQDNLEGTSLRYWRPETLASEEFFSAGKLLSGRYWDACGTLITEVCDGSGKRTLFGKDTVCEIIQYHRGIPEGKIELYNSRGQLVSSYFIKNNLKDGEEIQFYPQSLEPKLSITWYMGKIQGPTKTWYPNGQLENQREMSDNQKNGLLTAWYTDGSLMMIEEYDHDKLLRGEYYRKGESTPLTEVVGGKGMATFFNPEGHFLKRVSYLNGQPE